MLTHEEAALEGGGSPVKQTSKELPDEHYR
jgi:hypothetical protein